MSFILTIDGNDLDLRNPSPAHITVYDIAWALSQENRFGGRILRPYSVAEHLLLTAEIADRELGLDLHGQFASLMHDAHEAYTKDMFGPAKPIIGQAWYAWERAWEQRVRSAFAFHTAAVKFKAEIHRADLIALATEKQQLTLHTRNSKPWPSLEGIEPVSWVDLRSPERYSMTWEDWRNCWMDKHHELDFGRQQLLSGESAA